MRISYYMANPGQIAGKVNSRLRALKHLSFWRKCRGMHSGDKIFIIGNGPSLVAADLNAIGDNISIASNRIHLIYDECAWRPRYYTVVDPLVWSKYSDEIQGFCRCVYIPSILPSKLSDKVKVFKYQKADGKVDLGFSPDFEQGVYGGHTVTFQNIELAVHLGAREIFLTGCDHYYSGENNTNENEAVEHTSQVNHFSKKYRSAGEKVNPAPIKKMEKRYRDAKLACDALGVKIYNCTRGGHLEVFPRMELEEALKKP